MKPLKRAIKKQPQTRITTLAMMITALVRGSTARLSKMAGKVPSKAKNQSTFKRFQRWVANDGIDVQTFYFPFVMSILNALSRTTLRIAMDATSAGRKCQALVIGVIYKNRLLPLCWVTYKGVKGHAKSDIHIEALERLLPLVPDNADVLLVADGEYDNLDVLKWIQTRTSWKYAIRASKSTLVQYEGQSGQEEEKLEKALGVEKNELVCLHDVGFTKEGYGPVMVVGVWDEQYEEPIYLVSNMKCAKQAEKAYLKRFTIETLFSDQKGRGFGIDKSHISDPKRLERLLLATCLAYIWMVYFGVLVIKEKKWDLVDHTRQDKSLFRLGMDWLDRVLNLGLSFRAIFHIRGVM
jgi:hypothetical protein